MKKALILVWASLLACSHCLNAGADGTSKSGSTEKEISVFAVQWRCPAALDIGCGSHAKPVLLRLEENAAVSEAWLNRQGTVVAIVWMPGASRQERRTAEKILKEEKASKLSGSARTKAMTDFGAGKNWYRGADVDRLSEEEAGVIAARWIRRLQPKTKVAPEKAEGLRGALTEGLKNV